MCQCTAPVSYTHLDVYKRQVPHILCSGFSREDTEYGLLDLQFLGITDLLVLRGDKAKHESAFVPENNGYNHAIELEAQINDFSSSERWLCRYDSMIITLL